MRSAPIAGSNDSLTVSVSVVSNAPFHNASVAYPADEIGKLAKAVVAHQQLRAIEAVALHITGANHPAAPGQ